MTSEEAPGRAYVWTWLPGETEPVPAGLLEAIPAPGGDALLTFAYARSYRERPGAPALYLPELPVRAGRQEPPPGMDVAGVIRDAAPDAWGQRVVMRRLLGRDVRDRDPAELPLLAHLLHSGSDRPGALDFQASPDRYAPRVHEASLADLLRVSEDIMAGRPVPAGLHDALDAGSSVGGARPKANLTDGPRRLIAKFSSPADPYPVVKAEALAMDLARRAGLDVAHTELVEVSGRDVLLVARFDRGPNGTRRAFVSALTILELHEGAARHATYHDLADVVRARFTTRRDTLRELFARIAFNVLVGNTDDHARNHAAFWDGDRLTLTPAYDICPQSRVGQEAVQAMAYAPDGTRWAQLQPLVDAAAVFELTDREAGDLVDGLIDEVRDGWHDAADRARLTATDRELFWGRQVCNPFATYGYTSAPLRMP